MNLPLPKATAELIAMVVKPHINKALDNGDVETAKAFQTIVSTIETAVQLNAGIEFK